MTWNDALTQLRELLQELYPEVARARVVVADAGIPEGTIEFHAAAQVNWHTVVQQAHTRRQVAALVNVATRDYPGRAAELHTALAAYHAMLGASLQPSPPASPAFQVPYRRNPQFVGREAALTLLGELLVGEGSKAAVVAIAGMGGLGKTQLAAEFAHRRRQAFAGGVFWLNMAEAGEGDPIETQVAACAGRGGLGLPNFDALGFEQRIEHVRAAWNDPSPRLLIFDNLEAPALLARWRPDNPDSGSRVLLTTRRATLSDPPAEYALAE
jgi:hypothetical protein